MIVSRTPFRFTLGGGGTDLPSFYSKNGGLVVSMAIDKYMYITIKPDDLDHKIKMRYSQIEIVDSPGELKHDRAREALQLHRVYQTGMEINTCADVSSNTGLGSSGSFLVGLLNTLREYQRVDRSPAVLAEEACHIEIDVLREPVGKQDQYIAAFGGLKILDIDCSGKVDVRNVNISTTDLTTFLSKIHVYNTNVTRSASDILRSQQQMVGNAEDMLKRIKEYGYRTIEILETGNFDRYGILMDEHWNAKKQLSDKITLTAFDSIYSDCKAKYGVLGGKIIGAGGGGFFMLYVPERHKEVESYMKMYGYNRLNYDIDRGGSKILGNFLK